MTKSVHVYFLSALAWINSSMCNANTPYKAGTVVIQRDSFMFLPVTKWASYNWKSDLCKWIKLQNHNLAQLTLNCYLESSYLSIRNDFQVDLVFYEQINKLCICVYSYTDYLGEPLGMFVVFPNPWNLINILNASLYKYILATLTLNPTILLCFLFFLGF